MKQTLTNDEMIGNHNAGTYEIRWWRAIPTDPAFPTYEFGTDGLWHKTKASDRKCSNPRCTFYVQGWWALCPSCRKRFEVRP